VELLVQVAQVEHQVQQVQQELVVYLKPQEQAVVQVQMVLAVQQV
jgi:hypothetical protein